MILRKNTTKVMTQLSIENEKKRSESTKSLTALIRQNSQRRKVSDSSKEDINTPATNKLVNLLQARVNQSEALE